MVRLRVLHSSGWVLWTLLLVPVGAFPQGDAPRQIEVLSAHDATRLLVNQVKPDYPPVAHANYIEGQVKMVLTVGSDGHVRKAHVLRGHPLLAASALKAIRRWVYRPFVTAAGPIPFRTQVKVVFDLRNLRREHDRFPVAPEHDLEQQVRPPALIGADTGHPAPSSIRLHVLVSDQGEAIDSTLLSGPVASFESAQHTVAQWRFEPARWGNLAVPWYLDVDVPVDASQDLSRAAVVVPKP